MTSRRSFLAAIAAAIVLDPERALWVPGRKLISIPPALWIPDCDSCRFNVREFRARDLVRWNLGFEEGHLFPKFGSMSFLQQVWPQGRLP